MLALSVDAMGGDHAPGAVVAGAVEFLRSGGAEAEDVRLLLVGDPTAIRAELTTLDALDHPQIELVPASQVIAMDDHPTEAVRKKPDASLSVCARLVQEGRAAGTVSAGNTGATMFAAIRFLERTAGVNRPAIAAIIPTEVGVCLLVDGGANVDCRPSHLVQFALLGSVYSQRVFGVDAPRVGILSNGEEESKGNELVKEARPLLAAAPIHFIGSVEGNHVMEGRVEVAVCDGFAGNILLKSVEGMARINLRAIAEAVEAEPENEGLARAFATLRKRVDYAEIGGAPLLGVNGVSIIAHGRSDRRAMASAIRMAARAARSGYVGAVATALAGLRSQEEEGRA